ncbi:alpha/beta hydrolase [Tenacibaculum sp. MAR_2009_124]|uniref:alpha/beta hydrolase n=1 Tax=Tenacibaculum sp. MAR_2009_124 TaxID=1250059 RepID=UPI002101AF1D|nr:alpha/beta hydrolase family protein [Tenacibaculum sp. MAR_2009_124]
MNKTIKNTIIIPDTYAEQKEGFSVLYLLHGAQGNHLDWLSKVPKIKEYSDTHNIIIVCPDGGLTSWYFDSPIDESMKYETYISSELIETIDKKYNTNAQKKHRAITGLSMGGHGALYLALKHQDIWGAAGSMSGGVDIRPFPNDWDIRKRLGLYEENKNIWDEHTIAGLTHLLKNSSMKLIIDCGYDDFFFEVNKQLHDKLCQNNIEHDYIERPGKHNWEYWANAIQYQLLFFNDFFNGNQ